MEDQPVNKVFALFIKFVVGTVKFLFGGRSQSIFIAGFKQKTKLFISSLSHPSIKIFGRENHTTIIQEIIDPGKNLLIYRKDLGAGFYAQKIIYLRTRLDIIKQEYSIISDAGLEIRFRSEAEMNKYISDMFGPMRLIQDWSRW